MSDQVKITPAAEKLAKYMEIDILSIEATGPDGYITEEDVKAVIERDGSSIEENKLVGGPKIKDKKEEKKEEEVEVKKTTEVDLSDPAVREVLHAMVQEEIAKQGALPKQEVKKSLDEAKKYSPDPSDVLEEPAVFYSFCDYYSCYGDKVNGQTIHPPYRTPDDKIKPIKFTNILRRKRPSRTGKGEEVFSICRAIVHSKKEAEFMRSHSLFNIKFYDNIGSASSVDKMYQEKMQEVSNSIKMLDDMQVIRQAQESGIPISEDISSMRRALVDKRAKVEIENQKMKQVEMIKSQGVIKEANADTEKFIS